MNNPNAQWLIENIEAVVLWPTSEDGQDEAEFDEEDMVPHTAATAALVEYVRGLPDYDAAVYDLNYYWSSELDANTGYIGYRAARMLEAYRDEEAPEEPAAFFQKLVAAARIDALEQLRDDRENPDEDEDGEEEGSDLERIIPLTRHFAGQFRTDQN